MVYEYCRATTKLTDAEIVAIVRHLSCCETGEVSEGGIDILRIEAGCDLAEGHSGPHAGFQAGGHLHKPGPYLGREVSAWLFWGGAVREITWPAECPVKYEDGLSCLLFDGHEGPHLHYSGDEQASPAWLSHKCRVLR